MTTDLDNARAADRRTVTLTRAEFDDYLAAVDALRAFCGDHEATGFMCAGLNAAYHHARRVITNLDASSRHKRLDVPGALERLADRVEQIELADGSTPDTLEARAVLAQLNGDEEP